MFRKFFLYSKFKLKKWEKYSPKKRFKCLQKFENYYAFKQHRTPCEIVLSGDLPQNTFGLFKESNWKIYLNSYLIYDARYMFVCMNTLLHEGRHAYQHIVVKSTYENKSRVFKFSKAYKWKNSMQGYLSTSQGDSYADYANQSIELDANMYAYKQLKKVRRKYKEQKLYELEIKELERWFEDVAKLGREQYGVFYKSKIGKKNKKRYEQLSK